MAGNTNAKPTKQTKPATDATVVEATDGTAEQAVTPPVPGDMASFTSNVFETAASLIAGAGFFVRQDGEQIKPIGKDILAASFRQGKGISAVTADGRKFILKDGKINEA